MDTMSVMATEILGAPTKVSDFEFIGRTFEERRAALQQVDTYREAVKQALHDTVEGLAGQTVRMIFRPSSVKFEESNYWMPCYSLTDEVRTPLERTVRIDLFNRDEEGTLNVIDSESPHPRWAVGLGNVLSIEVIQIDAEQDKSGN